MNGLLEAGTLPGTTAAVRPDPTRRLLTGPDAVSRLAGAGLAGDRDGRADAVRDVGPGVRVILLDDAPAARRTSTRRTRARSRSSTARSGPPGIAGSSSPSTTRWTGRPADARSATGSPAPRACSRRSAATPTTTGSARCGPGRAATGP